jgi:hypothetical protein
MNMTKVLTTLGDLSSSAASIFTVELPFGPRLGNAFENHDVFPESILRHRLMVPDSDASRFRLGFFKGKISIY